MAGKTKITITNIFVTAERIILCLSEHVKDEKIRNGIWKDPEKYTLERKKEDGTYEPIPLDAATVSYTQEIPAVILYTKNAPGTSLRLTIRNREKDRAPGEKDKTFNLVVGRGSDFPEKPSSEPEIDPVVLGEFREAAQAVRDLSSYPFPTTEATPASSGSGGVAGPGSLGRMVENALKTSLGRLPRPGDTRSFVDALSQSFSLSEVEGRTVVAWTPHVLTSTTDLGGGVTGAQASLAAFAQEALRVTLPLIDGLYSLLPDPDPQELDAARSILRTEWIELVNELGIEGGPRASRVNHLRDRLWTQHLPNLGQQLGVIVLTDGKPKRDDNIPFIITRERVITVDEEQNLTNFIALKDYIFSVLLSCENYLKNRAKNEDLGTGLVLLARALSVVEEQVAQVYAAMDTVSIGPAEREVILLTLGDEGAMTVAELLSWVETFAAEEAPRLIQDGGLRGVQAIQPIAEKLEDLIHDFILEDELPYGLRQRRVKNQLMELEKYLSQVADQADRLIPNG